MSPVRQLSPRTWLVAAAVVAGLLAPSLLGASGLLVLMVGLAYAVAALGVLVLTGWTGQVSLGQVGFMGVGAFVTARLVDAAVGVPLWAAVPIAVLAAAVTSVVVGIPALRLRGVYFAVVTLAVAQVLETAVFSNRSLTGGGNGLQVHRPPLGPIDLASDKVLYYVLLGVLVAACAAVALLRRSDLGRRIRALRAAPQVVGARGIDAAAVMLGAVAISAALAGLAGSMLALALQSVAPASFGPLQSVMLLALVVVCGARSIAAAVAAGVLVGALPWLVARLLSDTVGGAVSEVLVGGVLLLVLVGQARFRDVPA